MNTLILIFVTIMVTAGYYILLNWLYRMNGSPATEATMAGLVGSVGSLVFAIALMFVYPHLGAGMALVCGICAGLAVFTGVAKFIAA